MLNWVTQLHYLGSRGEITPFGNGGLGCSGSPPSLGQADSSPAGTLFPPICTFVGWGRGGERFCSFSSALFFFSPSYYISVSFQLHTSSSAAKGGKIKTCMLGGWGEVGRGVGIGVCTLWYTEWLAIRDLLYSTENSTQDSVTIFVGKESEREWMCRPPSCPAEISATL